MGFLKGSQMLQQNCEQNKLYIFKNTVIDHISYFLMLETFYNVSKARPFIQTKFSATTNFLFSLASFHALNKSIFHDITI